MTNPVATTQSFYASQADQTNPDRDGLPAGTDDWHSINERKSLREHSAGGLESGRIEGVVAVEWAETLRANAAAYDRPAGSDGRCGLTRTIGWAWSARRVSK
jgi:hypothetical protein